MKSELKNIDQGLRYKLFAELFLFRSMFLFMHGTISVHNASKQLVENDREKAVIVKEWFKKHYTEDEPALQPFEGEPRPLNCPISVEEVETAAKRLKNGKAVGPDNIPNELLKNAPGIFYRLYADYVNDAFTNHNHVASFSEGYLTPLQKPDKPRGPCTSLRPLCLLNGTRKILSMITLRRIQNQVAAYTGPWRGSVDIKLG